MFSLILFSIFIRRKKIKNSGCECPFEPKYFCMKNPIEKPQERFLSNEWNYYFSSIQKLTGLTIMVDKKKITNSSIYIWGPLNSDTRRFYESDPDIYKIYGYDATGEYSIAIFQKEIPYGPEVYFLDQEKTRVPSEYKCKPGEVAIAIKHHNPAENDVIMWKSHFYN